MDRQADGITCGNAWLKIRAAFAHSFELDLTSLKLLVQPMVASLASGGVLITHFTVFFCIRFYCAIDGE